MAVDNERNPVLGMYVGSNRISVGRWNGDEPEAYTLPQGNDVEPSWIHLMPDGKVLVGDLARNCRCIEPEGSISGRRLLEAFNNSEPLIVANMAYKPPQLYGQILAYLYNGVAATFPKGHFQSREVVITVPGWFTPESRNRVRQSAERLGLIFRGTIQEHVAAILPWKFCGDEHSSEDLLVVCELEDDAFSATVIHWQLTRERCVAEILGHQCSKELGIVDLDERLASFLIQQPGVNLADVEPRQRRMAEAISREAAEHARKALCFERSYNIVIPELVRDKDGLISHLESAITRELYGDLVRDQITQIVNTVLQAVAQAGISVRDLNASMLVGEYTQIPILRQMLEEAIGTGKALDGFDPSLCSVQGAAIYAACLDGIEVFGRPLEVADQTERNKMDSAPHQRTVEVTCPGCGTIYRNVKPEQIGKVGRCRKCGHKFRVELKTDEPKPEPDSEQNAAILSAQTQARFGAAETVASSPRSGEEVSSKKSPARTPAATVYTKAPSDSASLHKAEHEVAADWKVGDVILDLYEVIAILGEGGMGKVYKVRHLGWDVDLAVKCPRKEYLASAGGIEDFAREAETWVNLGNHPNIVSCFYVRTLGDIPRVFAEYVEGGSLSDWIRTRKLYEGNSDEVLARILDIGIQTAWGLHYAHEKGLVHQDMKPGNVMMTPDGSAKITDFGLARAKGSAEPAVSPPSERKTMVVAGAGMYTPEYASPEQLTGSHLTRRTDIWSWAASVVEMFAGELLWSLGTAVGEFLNKNLANWSGLENAGPRPPGSVTRVLRKCFELQAEDRPGNLAEIVTVLREEFQQITRKVYPRLEPNVEIETADSLNNRAVSLMDLGNSDDALKLWDMALKVEPEHPLATYNRAVIRWRTGRQSDLALLSEMSELKVAGGLEQNDCLPHCFLGLIHVELGDYQPALQLLKSIHDAGALRREVAEAISAASRNEPPPYTLISELKGHTEGVTCVHLSHDARFAISGSLDKTLKLWDIAAGACVRTFEGHTDRVTCVGLSRDNQFAVSGSWDRTLKIWDLSTGKCVSTLRGHERGINYACMSGDGRFALSGSYGDTPRLWQISTGSCVRTFEDDKVTCVCLSHDGQFALLGSGAHVLELWDTSSWSYIMTLKGHTDDVRSAFLSHDGRFALSGGFDNIVKLWDLGTGSCIRTFEGHTSTVDSVCLSQDGRFALSGGASIYMSQESTSATGSGFVRTPDDGTIRLWDTATGQCLRTLATPNCSSAHFGNIPGFAVSCGKNGTSVWSLAPCVRSYSAPILMSKIRFEKQEMSSDDFYEREMREALYVMEDGDAVEAAGRVRKVRMEPRFARHPQAIQLWTELSTKLPKKSFAAGWKRYSVQAHTLKINSLWLSADTRHALSAGSENTMKLWEISTGNCLKTFEGHRRFMNFPLSVCLSHDGRFALSGCVEEYIEVWDISAGKCIRVLQGHTDSVFSVRFSRDDRFILSGCDDGILKLWDFRTGTCIRTLEGHTSTVDSICMSGDDRFVLSGSRDNTIKLWDIRAGSCVRTFEGHSEFVYSVCLSKDCRFALSGSGDHTIKLWDIETGSCIRTFMPCASAVNTVCLTSDGKFALSGDGQTVRLWDVASGMPVYSFNCEGEVKSVCLSEDGNCAVWGDSSGTLTIWDLDWELEDRYTERWDEVARPYLEIFLRQHSPYAAALPQDHEPAEEEITLALTRRGKPTWTEDDFSNFLYTLGCAGYGWLRPEGVRRELEEMAEILDDSGPQDGRQSETYHKTINQGLPEENANGHGVAQDEAEILDRERTLAAEGNAQAQYILGIAYYQGQGVPQDYTEAANWFRKAAEQGHTEAQCQLGLSYFKGLGVRQDFEAAVNWFRKAAAKGDAPGQYNLGLCYLQGEGIRQDHMQAANWLRKASEQGLAGAQAQLGLCYYQGQGVPQDHREAVNWFRKAAEQGEAQAQYNLGVLYCEGQAVPQDFVEAVKWYRKAAEQGSGDAQCNLGNCYAQGQGVPEDYAEAVDWYRKAAEQGLPDAQCNLGNCYLQGQGVPEDCAEAADWYRKAAEQGHVRAQYNLGLFYFQGAGVPQDHNEAIKWYRKAAEQGHEQAQLRLKEISEGEWEVHAEDGKNHVGAQDSDEIVIRAREAAEQGNAVAQFYLGLCYYQGDGVPQNHKEAVYWFRKAAEQGHAEAQFHLGGCYHQGQGVAQDFAAAISWFRKAAEQGFDRAQYNLGCCYYQGRGVPQDYRQAVYWFRKAAEQENTLAQSNLGWCYYEGEGISQDFAQAVSWFRKAAEQGDAGSQFHLGRCYYQGEGVAQSLSKATDWFRKAAEHGHSQAQFVLGMAYFHGDGVSQNLNNAVDWFRRAADQGHEQAQLILKAVHESHGKADGGSQASEQSQMGGRHPEASASEQPKKRRFGDTIKKFFGK